jgi:uncharacterized phage-like protein YoqJ
MIICGTGHRPNKLGGYGSEVADRLFMTARDFLISRQVYGQSVTEVISGGALGWDQALAWAAVYEDIPLTLALPFPGFHSKWPSQSQEGLELLVSKADQVIYVCDAGYAPWKMQKRNEWMVDQADKVLALWDGSPGGTANCVAYANKVKKPIINLWEVYGYDQEPKSAD